MTYKLVLLRHGQSEWNEKNLFTGWVDVPLTDKGRAAYEYHKDFHERMIASLVDTLSPEQTALLAQSLEKLQDFFRHEEAAVEGETNG